MEGDIDEIKEISNEIVNMFKDYQTIYFDQHGETIRTSWLLKKDKNRKDGTKECRTTKRKNIIFNGLKGIKEEVNGTADRTVRKYFGLTAEDTDAYIKKHR